MPVVTTFLGPPLRGYSTIRCASLASASVENAPIQDPQIPPAVLAEDRSIRAQAAEEGITPWLTAFRDMAKCQDALRSVVWLPFSSSWLFTTGRDCRWCIDPAPALYHTTEEECQTIGSGIGDLDACLLTHLHGDHYCVPLLKAAEAKGHIHWFVPEFMAPVFLADVAPAPQRLTIMRFGDSADFKGLKIFCLPGYHQDATSPKQVGSAAYAVHLPDGLRLAFPGDARDYAAPIPEPLQSPDLLFAHLWLGRDCSHLDSFPAMEDFCSFCLRFKPRRVILGHLLDISRDALSMWTCRHARLVRQRLTQLAPALELVAPAHDQPLLLDREWIPDHYASWTPPQRQEFAQNLGISIKKDFQLNLERAIQQRIPVVELNANVFKTPENLDAACRLLPIWRQNGGRCLSLHLGYFHQEADAGESLRLARFLGADRVTKHVPSVSVAEYAQRREEVLQRYLRQIQPMVDNGILVGIENMHTKPGSPVDDARGYGFRIEEWMEFILELRKRCGSPLLGAHVDVGHAYTNAPFHWDNTLETWLRAGGELINGVHIHQYCEDRNWQTPHPDGHFHVSGRTAGFPCLEPLYRLWQQNVFRAPLILEVRKGEDDPTLSRQRLLKLPLDQAYQRL